MYGGSNFKSILTQQMLLLLYIWAPRDTVILNHSLLMKSKMNKKCLLLTLQTLVPALFMMSKTQISSLVHEVKDTDVQTQNGCAHSCIFVIFMSVFVKPEHKSTEKLLQVFFFKKKRSFYSTPTKRACECDSSSLGIPFMKYGPRHLA